MSLRQALLSALHLFIVFALVMMGLFCLGLSQWPLLRDRFFEECDLVGLGLLGIALILCLAFYLLDRGRYLVIRMGVGVDLSLLRQSVENCLLRQFPKQVLFSDLDLGNRSEIQIRVSLLSLKGKAQEELLSQVERQLTLLLRERFGYGKPFHLLLKV